MTVGKRHSVKKHLTFHLNLPQTQKQTSGKNIIQYDTWKADI
jgi:hypothetical protein